VTAAESPKRSLLRGAAWTVGTRWGIKAIAFVNTIIMARLILPADYGVVAMAMLVVGLIQAMMDFGAATAIVRKETVSDDFVNSAWTLRLFQSLGIALLLVSVSWAAAASFEEPRVLAVLWVLAIGVLVQGLTNIGLVLAQKAFNFSVDFKVKVVSKIISVAVTLGLGLWLRDYRALVAGMLVGFLAECFLSYLWHPYRPRWCVKDIPEIWDVTKWLMLSTLGNYLLLKVDELVVSKLFTTSQLGVYSMGKELGLLPVNEVGPAIVRSILPVMSSIQDDRDRLRAAITKTLSAANTLTLPIGFGVAAVAPLVTAVVLGPNWLAAAPVVALFALSGSVRFMMSPLESLLILDGHTRSLNTAIWMQAFVLGVGIWWFIEALGMVGLAWARLLSACFYAIAIAFFAASLSHLETRQIFSALIRPLGGSALMYLMITSVLPSLPGGDVSRLLAAVTLGAVFYTTWSLLSWRVAGRPEGLESTVLDLVRAVVQKRARSKAA
jgi:O-antigen/teichoic acid export membrane protein